MKPCSELDGDVVVAGAGGSGAVCALLLARLGMRVLLIEARSLPQEMDEEHPGRLAITPASQNILRRVGAWQDIPEAARCPFAQIRVWDESGRGQLHFDAAKLCLPCLGHIVSTQHLLRALHGRLLTHANVRVLAPAELVMILTARDHVGIALRDGRRLQASLIVGADGADSKLRQLAGINYRNIAYRQHTVTAIVDTERAHQQVARQRFLRSGLLAFLPLDHPRRCVALWSTKPGHAEYLLHTEAEDFNRELGEAFDHDAGWVRLRGARTSHPLHRAHAEHYSQERLALVGDAAHSVHPLAGLGANLGLLDAACLAELLGGARQAGRDIGGRRWLHRYECWRRSENQLMMMAFDGLKKLFENQNVLLRWARNAGMDVLDGMPPIKGMIARRAMGLSGTLPVLARQEIGAEP